MEKIVIIILGVVLANFILGTITHLGKDFSFKVFVLGLFEVIKKQIALLSLIAFYVYFGDVEIIDVIYAPIAMFIALLSTVYHLNSCLVNICSLLGLEDVKVLGELDKKFKELMNKSFFEDKFE